MPTSTLPHWDMTVLYPGLESPEFEAGFAAATQAITELVALFDRLQIGQRPTAALDAATIAAAEQVITGINEVIKQSRTLTSYIYSFVSTDSRNDLAQAKTSAYQRYTMQLAQLNTRFNAWIGSLDSEQLIAQSPVAAEHAFVLRHASEDARHQMSPAEEALASELNLSSGIAWAKLHGNLTSQITVPFEQDGEQTERPMSMIRNLAMHPDRNVRQRAYEAELAGWQQAALPLASALNSIKGEVNTLARRRGWASPVDTACFDNHIDRATLDAMMTAAHESFPEFRRYLRAKAKLLGLPKLAWFDLFAPVGGSNKVWEYDDATSFIVDQFGKFSPRLSDFAARAFREEWVDAEPRPGKRDGAFCMLLRNDESRIFANFSPSFDSMSTLAHELGHGYHNLALAERTALQHNTPMTLAETASIFCQTIIQQAALAQGDRSEQLEILEGAIQDACQVVVDITSRFLFEQEVFRRRQERELSIDELNQIMLQSQRDTYGDGLDQTQLHPYMWAVKGHYYSTGRSFYNFPYMFGLLFGLGLYARYQQDPETFRASYDDLLSSTGLDDAAGLAARFGIDIRTPDFWRASLAIIRGDIDRFEQLVG